MKFLLICLTAVVLAQQPPRLVTRVDPHYPPLALQARIQGIVRMEITVGDDGRVASTKLIMGHPLLVQPAIDAVKQWIYERGPATLMVEVPFTLPAGAIVSNARPPQQVSLLRGQKLSVTEARELEQRLADNPEDNAARASLLGYYTANRHIAERRELVLWLVKNHPESALLQGREALVVAHGNSLSDPEGYAALRSQWLAHTPSSADNPSAWINAINFLLWQDKAQAERIIHNADPPAALPMMVPGFRGILYARAIMGLVAVDDEGKPVFDPTDAGSGLAQRAKAALETTNDVGVLTGAILTFQEFGHAQPDQWDAMIGHLQQRKEALSVKR